MKDVTRGQILVKREMVTLGIKVSGDFKHTEPKFCEKSCKPYTQELPPCRGPDRERDKTRYCRI